MVVFVAAAGEVGGGGWWGVGGWVGWARESKGSAPRTPCGQKDTNSTVSSGQPLSLVALELVRRRPGFNNSISPSSCCCLRAGGTASTG